jgi:hypothetical protein
VEYEDNDPRKEIENHIEVLVAIGLVTVVGMTDDGHWLYSLTDRAKEMTEEERLNAVFGYIEDAGDEDWDLN